MVQKFIDALLNYDGAVDISLSFGSGAQSHEIRVANVYVDKANDLCIEGENGEYCTVRDIHDSDVLADEIGEEFHVRKEPGIDWMFSLPIC